IRSLPSETTASSIDPMRSVVMALYSTTRMADTGRAAVYVGKGQPFEIREYPVPEPEPGAALVQITLANVCGSDLHLWRGELDPVRRGRAVPIHQGHEGTGRIAALGEGLTTDSTGQPLQVGDRIVFDYFYPYPNHMVFKVPDDLPDALVAGVNCAMAQVTCGLDLAGLRLGESVVIQGAGGLGLYAVAGVPERLEVAAQFGADEVIDLRELPDPAQRARRVRELTGGWGADVALELAGFPAITEEGIMMLGPGGRYVEIGNISPGLTYAADPALWVVQNISIFGNNHYGRRHLRDALELLRRARQRYPFDRIVSHTFPLTEINEVMAAQDRGAITRASLVP